MKIQTLYTQKPRCAVDPVYWAETVRTIKGRRFTFKDRDYLHQLYRDPASDILVKKGRQMEITELAVNIGLYWATSRPYTRVIYISPRSDQVSRVSKDRYRPAITYAQNNVLSDALERGEKSVERMKFANESIIYFVSGWGDGDAIRNIDGDVIIFDEVQDLTDAAIDTAKEAASHSEIKKFYYIGSPKLAGSGFERRWKQSDMKEWDREKECWVESLKKPDAIYYSGYHITQMMARWVSEEEIEKKRATMTEQQFVNEVMGEFYAGGQVKLTLEEILECCDWTRKFETGWYQAPKWCVAGIDWGKPSYFIVYDDMGNIVNACEFDKSSITDPDNTEPTIIDRWMKQYQIRTLVCDMGYGEAEVAALQDKYGPKVMGCYFVKRDDIIIERNYLKNKQKKEIRSRPLLNANRTRILDKVYELFHKKFYQFPYHKSTHGTSQVMFDHFLALFEKLTDPTMYASGRRVYENMGPDHYMFALAYATAAYLYCTGLTGPGYEPISAESEFAREMEEEYGGPVYDIEEFRAYNWG